MGLPTDGDVFIFYYRKDLLEDPAEQAAFAEEYGRDLAVPVTYDEYNEVLEFFTRPEDNLYGAAEWRIRAVNYWWFWQRLWSGGGTYFNDDMSAAVNSAAGVQALEDMIALADVMPPDALSYGYVETVEAMTSGLVFSNITWPAAGKNANDPETSSTVGKWGYATVPGYVVDGSVNQKSMSAPGYTILVSNYSDIDKEAAYLYTQWFTSPENLIQANQNLGGNTDVVRASIFADPAMAELFPGAGAYLDAQKANLAQAVPDPVLPGYGEYAQALEIEDLQRPDRPEVAPDALDDAAEAWTRSPTPSDARSNWRSGRTSWHRSPARSPRRPRRRAVATAATVAPPGPAGLGGRRARRRSRALRRPRIRWLFVAPAVLLLLGLTVYPFGYAIYISLHTWKTTFPRRPSSVWTTSGT